VTVAAVVVVVVDVAVVVAADADAAEVTAGTPVTSGGAPAGQGAVGATAPDESQALG
jgi:hypothetical protein